MTGWGHKEQFSPPALSARYVIRQEIFAGTHGNVRGAPIADAREAVWLANLTPVADLRRDEDITVSAGSQP